MKNSILLRSIAIVLLVATSLYVINRPPEKREPREAQLVLRLAEALPDHNPVTIAMHKFADLVNDKTAGKVIVKIHSSGQFGQESEAIEQTQLGIIDLTRVNSVVVANVSPSMGVFTLPYIFRDFDHKYRVLDGKTGDEVRADLNDIGLIGFDFMDAGSRSFYTRNKAIESIDDLAGLKIRVQPSLITIRMIELMGGVPTPMNYGEVYTALSTGVIDGAENDYVSYSTSGHYEVAPFYVEDRHLSPPAILLMNYSTFQSLAPEIQQAIRESAQEAAYFERRTMTEANLQAKEKMSALNVHISTIDVTPFRAAVEPIYEEFPSYARLIEQIDSLR